MAGIRRTDDGSETWFSNLQNTLQRGGSVPLPNINHRQIAQERARGAQDEYAKRVVEAYTNAPHYDPVPLRFGENLLGTMQQKAMQYQQMGTPSTYNETIFSDRVYNNLDTSVMNGRTNTGQPYEKMSQQPMMAPPQPPQSSQPKIVTLARGATLFFPLKAGSTGVEFELARVAGPVNEQIAARECVLKGEARVFVVPQNVQTINLQEIQRNQHQTLVSLFLVEVPMVGSFFVAKEGIYYKQQQQINPPVRTGGLIVDSGGPSRMGRQILNEQRPTYAPRIVNPQTIFANKRPAGGLLKG